MYLSNSRTVDPDQYFKLNMLGAILTYDVNLSETGCGCVTKMYLARMPASANVYDPFRYCDANQGEGYFCPEFDIMQANKFGYTAKGHRCVSPSEETPGFYTNCDRSG